MCMNGLFAAMLTKFPTEQELLTYTHIISGDVNYWDPNKDNFNKHRSAQSHHNISAMEHSIGL